jgi:flagellar biosynthesis/type III secretory pathway protein FliH
MEWPAKGEKMKNYAYIKKVLNVSILGAAALLAAVTANAQNESKNAEWQAAVKAVSMDPDRIEKAREAIRLGYKQGHKEGRDDASDSDTYNDKVRMPDAENPPSGKYKAFYEQGYMRGYEDGYKNTTKYGVYYEKGRGYSVHSSVENSLINGSS